MEVAVNGEEEDRPGMAEVHAEREETVLGRVEGVVEESFCSSVGRCRGVGRGRTIPPTFRIGSDRDMTRGDERKSEGNEVGKQACERRNPHFGDGPLTDAGQLLSSLTLSDFRVVHRVYHQLHALRNVHYLRHVRVHRQLEIVMTVHGTVDSSPRIEGDGEVMKGRAVSARTR